MPPILGLTHYAELKGGSIWIEPTWAPPDSWFWMPGQWINYPLDLQAVDMFISAGWEDVGTTNEMSLTFFVLASQLVDMRLTVTSEDQDITERHLWIPKTDRERIEALPVMLTFTAPLELQKRALVSSLAKQIHHPSPIPPPQLGEQALVITIQDNRAYYGRCKIKKLPETSLQLQQHMGAALSRLASAPPNLAPSAWLEQWKEIQEMARRLAADYWRAYQGTQQVKPPHVPNIFKDGAAWSGLNMGLQGTQSAIYHKENWKEEPGMLPSYTQPFEHGYTKVWLQEPGPDRINGELASEELTKRLARLSDLEADIVTIQIAQAMAAENGQAETFLTPEAIFEYRGLQAIAHKEGNVTRYSGMRTEDREAIIRTFENTAWLRLKVVQGVKHKGRPIEVESAYVLIKEWVYQPTLDDTPRRLLAWRYQMGTWLAPFMDEAEAGRYFGLLMKKTLEYNIKNELVEKRLARYFAIHLCIAAHNGAALIRRNVGKLLDECGIPLDQRNPERSKKRFEKALEKLVTDGIIGDWKYTDESELPARQWLDNWRGRSIMVTLGPKALQAYEPMLEKAQARRAAIAAPQKNKRQGKRKTG